MPTPTLPVVSFPMRHPPSPPQRRPAPPTPTRIRPRCSTTWASTTMGIRRRFGPGGDDHRRGRERATRTSTRGASLALESPLSRPTLLNRSPALLLSPLSPLDPMPTGPLARSPASSTPPRASTALPGPPLDMPASPTQRRSQSLAPLSYYDLEPLLRHASLDSAHAQPYACSRTALSCASPPLLIFPLSTLHTLAA